jgi:hypothetical protein
VKGWHNAFENVVDFSHEPATKLARQLEIGVQPGKKKKKKKAYVKVSEALHAIVTD